MLVISSRARSIAEDMLPYLPPWPGSECLTTPRYVAFVGTEPIPRDNLVTQLRLGPGEAPAVVDEVRALFAARGRRRVTWTVGNSATPRDLTDDLARLGMEPAAPFPVMKGMVLAQPLSPAASSALVRRGSTLEDLVTAAEIFRRCFGEESFPADAMTLARRFEAERALPGFTRYLAYLGEQPVAVADAIHLNDATILTGGATLPEARGRGVYRALVAARWNAAQQRGASTLITQAGPMSRPILAQLGFVDVATVRVLLDTF